MFTFTYNMANISKTEDKMIDRMTYATKGALTKAIVVIEMGHAFLGLLGTSLKVLRDSKECIETCRDYFRVAVDSTNTMDKDNAEVGGYVEPKEDPPKTDETPKVDEQKKE